MRRSDHQLERLVAVALVVVIAGCAPTAPAATSPSASPPPTAPPATRSVSLPSASPALTPGPSPTPSPRPPTPSPSPEPLEGLSLEVIADGIENPLDVKARPGDGALFVIEQQGVIRRAADGGTMLDVRDRVNVSSIEQGLLGFAFHPDYPDDPRVFVFHSKANNDNVLASYESSGDPDVLDPGTRRDLLTIDKDADQVRHNGGTVLFGPDGFLYLSLGDAARYSVNAQNPATLPASILRIDIDVDAGGAQPYAIPAGNPFGEGGTPPQGLTGAPEVWWFGLRNPWRFSIDEPTGLAYIADVGQARAEEVNVVPLEDGGLNFGWPAREGKGSFVDVPLVSEATEPVLEIRHNDKDRGCSVTGGEVYRGRAIPELVGHYFYADWCRGWIRSFRYDDGAVLDAQDWESDLDTKMVSSFGHDADGELLVLDWEADALYRIVPVRKATSP